MGRTGRQGKPQRRFSQVKQTGEGVYLTDKQTDAIGCRWYDRQRLSLGVMNRRERRKTMKVKGENLHTFRRRVELE